MDRLEAAREDVFKVHAGAPCDARLPKPRKARPPSPGKIVAVRTKFVKSLERAGRVSRMMSQVRRAD
ncbi:MAG TPA: hypothetical protein VKQ27_02120 [Acetobacteraceae bacterium]|nr:hypothetical protein [Acetobacteraceae bacterium]